MLRFGRPIWRSLLFRYYFLMGKQKQTAGSLEYIPKAGESSFYYYYLVLLKSLDMYNLRIRTQYTHNECGIKNGRTAVNNFASTFFFFHH